MHRPFQSQVADVIATDGEQFRVFGAKDAGAENGAGCGHGVEYGTRCAVVRCHHHSHSIVEGNMDTIHASQSQPLDVVVVGGGLAGLAAARLCQRSGARVLVVEPHGLGGRARSDVIEGFSFNLGPHALYLGGPAQRILRDLGIVATGGPPATKRTYGVRGDEVGLLPAGPASLMRTRFVGLGGKLAIAKVLGQLPRMRSGEHSGETVGEWIDSLKVPSAAAELLHMLVRVATYAEAPDLLSADVAISQLQFAVGQGVLYVDGGWASLVTALAASLEIHAARVGGVHADGPTVAVDLEGGDVIRARAAIVAVGLPGAAARLLGREPFDVGPPLEAACLELGLRLVPERRVLFGIDQPLYFSVHSPPAKLGPEGTAVAHVARYVAPAGSGGRLSDRSASPEASRTELEAHARLAGVSETDVLASRYLHRMAVVGGIATAAGGGLPGRPTVRGSGVPKVFLAGDWVGPVGHLADAALARAEEAARLAGAA